jgi:uncharacterized membrane protein YgdD (TMEM256/DUF423 family)
MKPRTFALWAALSALIAVTAGAFGAHVLRERLPSELLAAFETGARYHMYHALALFAVAWAETQWPSRLVRASGWLFIAGTALFSGSLYVLALTGVTWWGAVTPVGGVLLILGWAALALGVWRR